MDELSKALAKAKSSLFVGTVWLSEEIVTADWAPDVNRKLDSAKTTIMQAAWSKAGGASLLRLKPENSVIVTISKEVLEDVMDSIVTKPTLEIFRSVSLGPNNGQGQVYDLADDFAAASASRKDKIFRLEAGQHRLRVIKDLVVHNHPGQWPAQIFLRSFEPPVLNALRANPASFTLTDNESDTLWTISPLFKKYIEGGRRDKGLVKLIKRRLGSNQAKLATFFFKPPGLVWQEIIAHYPNAGIGVTGNRLAVLNGSYFQDVSAPIIT